MANDKIKVAVIGCGTIANSAHIPSYMANDTCEIKYFCDIIPERADAAVEKYGCGKAIYDYHEILNDPEIEAVTVEVSNNELVPMAIRCAEKGKTMHMDKTAGLEQGLEKAGFK